MTPQNRLSAAALLTAAMFLLGAFYPLRLYESQPPLSAPVTYVGYALIVFGLPYLAVVVFLGGVLWMPAWAAVLAALTCFVAVSYLYIVIGEAAVRWVRRRVVRPPDEVLGS